MRLRAVKRLLRRSIPEEVEYRLLRAAAVAHRSTLARGVTVAGVTGSAGKTTAKELLAAALGARFRCSKNAGNRNRRTAVCRSLFRAGPWCRFHVQEIALGRQGLPLDEPIAVVRPRIGVVTTVGGDHRSAYGGLAAIAAEKAKLVAALPPSGTAVLNADDPNVLAMAARCRGRVVTFGLAPTADVRAENVSGAWPGRLAFDVVHRGERLAVRTQLVGTLWVPSVLAAVAAAVAAGVPFAAAVEAVAAVPPIPGGCSR
jgi:UDP-N-acetylmuramoyl-tripeptide--D-alanyl-D-alanine ligase